MKRGPEESGPFFVGLSRSAEVFGKIERCEPSSILIAWPQEDGFRYGDGTPFIQEI